MKKSLLLIGLMGLLSCGDGHTGDEEEGHRTTYSLANSDSTSDTVPADRSQLKDMDSIR